MKQLTVRERKFVDAYVGPANGGGVKALRLAGYLKGGKPNTLKVLASRMIRKPHIAAALEARLAKAGKESDITAERVVQELGRVALFDIRRIFDDEGNLLPVSELPADVAAALSSIEFANGSSGTKYRAHDKNSALVALCRRFGLFQDKVKLSLDVEDFLPDEATP